MIKAYNVFNNTERHIKDAKVMEEKDIKRLKNIYNCMRQRCNNPKNTAAFWYHDKGIRVCDEWENNFQEFVKWSFENGYNSILTIDRIDPDGNYCPENCRWITKSENCRRARKITSNSAKRVSTKIRYKVCFVDRYSKEWRDPWNMFLSYSKFFEIHGTFVAGFAYYSDAKIFRDKMRNEQSENIKYQRYLYEIMKV